MDLFIYFCVGAVFYFIYRRYLLVPACTVLFTDNQTVALARNDWESSIKNIINHQHNHWLLIPRAHSVYQTQGVVYSLSCLNSIVFVDFQKTFDWDRMAHACFMHSRPDPCWSNRHKYTRARAQTVIILLRICSTPCNRLFTQSVFRYAQNHKQGGRDVKCMSSCTPSILDQGSLRI